MYIIVISFSFRFFSAQLVYICKTPLFPETKPNSPSFLSFSVYSALPSVSLFLTSPTLLLDQVLEEKPHMSLLLPPLIVSHLLGKFSLQPQFWIRNSASIQSLTQYSCFLCDLMINSLRFSWGNFASLS